MKKLVVLVCLAFTGIVAANAQVVWGGRVGLCYATISADGGATISGEPSFELGPVLYYALKDNFYINSGAMFSIKNFTVSSGGSSSTTESLNLYYVEVPLYIGYAFPIGGLDFYAQAGPYAGFKVSESLPLGMGESGISSFNAGLGFAGGINIKRFKIELGYQNGLTNVINAEEGDDGFKATLGSVFFGVSYVF
jgi:hypothetical protein